MPSHADTVLADFNHKGTWSEADAAAIMRGMLKAVQHCHSRGVLHRDVKPENFLWEGVGGSGVLKIADFGISCFWDPESPPRDTCGTALYMAPETWKKLPYETEVDVWGLGVSLALLLTGKYPFDGDTPEELTKDICERAIDLHAKPFCNLSPGACNLLSRLLEKDQRKRITISEALQHPWVVEGGTARTSSLTGSVISGVAKIINMNQLHEAILGLMAKNAMKSRELPSLQRQFHQSDINGDGKIDPSGMARMMRRRGSLTTDDEAVQIVERLDSSGGGALSFEQFVVGEIHFRAQVDCEKRMKAAFRLLDRDGDGSVSSDDMERAMGEAGIASAEEVKSMFKQLDQDGDGMVTFEEFSEFWKLNVQEASQDAPQGRSRRSLRPNTTFRENLAAEHGRMLEQQRDRGNHTSLISKRNLRKELLTIVNAI